MPVRIDGRAPEQLRPVKITRNYIKYAEGSCLVEFGNTHVICTASVEETVPPFLKGKGTGWVSAEYGMLPRSCHTRVQRSASKGRIDGRAMEIQRLIGRSLRTITDMSSLGERTIWIDCDVIQADGGTRCASICGGFIALADALIKLQKEGKIRELGIQDYVAAVSVGIIQGTPMLDLVYEEDSTAEVDMNIIMTGAGEFIEVQGTAERRPFSEKQMKQLVDTAKSGIEKLIEIQKKLLADKIDKNINRDKK